eukprot:Gb_11662 [translate_table: standard]
MDGIPVHCWLTLQEDAERIEDDGFEEITNLTNWSHSLPNFEIAHAFSDRFSKGQTVNSGKIHRGGSDELSGLTGKQNETIGYYRGLESTKSKGLQPFIRRNRVSVDHLSPRVKSKVSPKTQSIKSGIKDNGFQGSITQIRWWCSVHRMKILCGRLFATVMFCLLKPPDA